MVSSSKHILLHEGRVSCEQIHMHHCCIPPAAFLPATRTPPPTNMSLCSLSVISSINSLSIVSSFPCTNAAFLLQHSCQPQAHLFPPTHACGTQKHSFFKTRQAMIHLCVCVCLCVLDVESSLQLAYALNNSQRHVLLSIKALTSQPQSNSHIERIGIKNGM